MDQFGHYRIEELIGSGATGEVYRAHDERRDQAVAVKLLPAALGEDARYKRRFHGACTTAARLREPHVIRIHDFGEIDGRLYLSMRLVDGPSLAALLAAGPLAPGRAVDLVGQVAVALDAAHAAKLVHRAVKPSNILVTPPDSVQVVDFGLAQAAGPARSQPMTNVAGAGMWAYLAPERFENQPIDARADVYSLACVLHECLTGVKPFAGDDLPALMYAHLQLPPPRPSELVAGVPPQLDRVVARGMAKEPDERYATAGELAAAARAALLPAAVPTDLADDRTADDRTADDRTTPVAVPAGRFEAAAPVPAASPTPRPAPRPAPSPSPAPQPAPASGPSPIPAPRPAAGPPPGPPPVPPPGGPDFARRPRRPATRLVLLALLLVILSAAATALVIGPWRGGGEPSEPLDPQQAAPAQAPPVPVAPAAPLPTEAAPAPVGNSSASPTVGPTVPVGPTPGYMEIAPNGRYAYIANRGAGVLTVFDTTINSVTGAIPVPEGGPQFVAFSPDGTRAYVSIFNNDRTVNEVGVLDTATSTFVARVPTGVRPFALDVTPDGRTVYVPNHDSGSITVIDTASNAVTATVEVAPNPHWVDVSEDGTRLYAANHESNVVTILDTATNTPITTVPVGLSPHSILAHPSEPLLFNVNYDSSSMSVTDLNSNAVIATVPTAPHPQDVSMAPDGRHGYLATVDDNAIQVFDATTFAITARVPTGRSPTSIAVAPNGRQAYVTNLDDGTVTVLNIAGTA
ncbi:serine/threonine-protein kinase [Pseudonocardia humida]|uniref:Protein kinase n=1 Tax=Pseudonocardia humida TaxID=2800819 RepID=A0ABT1A9U7_9PSEU|nr:serine/threonine-protein kinase [Pseudonocardia humida]MCO1659821.1 protein kinase [Pseudonocardia humida]